MKPVLDLLRYEREDGTVPLERWLLSLRDLKAQARVRVRLQQLRFGNFGDCVSVGEGVVELRIHLGPGYRVYCGRDGQTVVVLLSAGVKHTQAADIRQAKAYWNHWKRSV